jgi:hypothetical protein
VTDILDLEGWNVIAKRIDGDDYLIEAEYTAPQPDRTAELAPSPAPHSGRRSPVDVPASTDSD